MQARLFSGALSLICEIYDVADVDFDDSGDEYEEVIYECENYLNQIIQCSDPEYRRILYSECLNRCNGVLSRNNDEMWQNILLNDFTDREYLHQNIQLIEQALIASAYEGDEHWIAWLVRNGIKMMHELGNTEAEVAAFRQRYRAFPTIRSMELDEALEKNDIPCAIRLLQESKRLDVGQ